MICNLGVVGSNPTRGSGRRDGRKRVGGLENGKDNIVQKDIVDIKGGYQSGQMGQTVNLLALAFGGSNPSPPTSVEVLRIVRSCMKHKYEDDYRV